MKVLIAYPPITSDKGRPTLGQNRQFQWFSNPSYLFPVVPATAATLLAENDFEVRWNDGIAKELTPEQFNDYFLAEQPDLVAMETKTPVIKDHWRIVSELKNLVPDARFALMGDHVTALPEESIIKCPSLDYVITGGDYDVSLLKLAEHLRDESPMPKGIWHREDGHAANTGGFELTENLDELPFIDRDLVEWNLYKEFNFKNSPYTYIMAGRDCPWHRCTFCSWTTLYPTFRVRSQENVLDEIGMLIDRYGVREIFDDSGTFPPGKWLEEFCQGMIERGYNEKIYFSCNFRFDYLRSDLAKLMKTAGFRLIKSGLESGNQETLDRINKGLKLETIRNGCKIAGEAGLEVHLTMIVGYPWETKEDAMNTLKLAKDLMLSNMAEVLQATVVVPYPGTPLYDQAIKNNWFRIDPQDYERYDMREPVLISGMSAEDTMRICSSIYREIFLSPKFVVNHLLKIKSSADIRYAFKGVRAVLGHITDFSKARN